MEQPTSAVSCNGSSQPSADASASFIPDLVFEKRTDGKYIAMGFIDPSTGDLRRLTPDEVELCRARGWDVGADASEPFSELGTSKKISLLDRPRKIINGGYSKRGELATEKDAVLLGLQAEDAEGIFICDRSNSLVMFHCKDFSFTKDASSEVEEDAAIPLNVNASVLQKPLSEASRARVSAVRGWIMDQETGTLLCRSFSEDSILFVEETDFNSQDWSSYSLKKCKEGTTIRIFWNGKDWSHSTNRKINCEVSRIPGVEIEVFEMFKQGCPEFSYDNLNRDVIYIFQLVHRDNQVMNPKPVEKPRVYHLASITASHTSNPMQLLDLSDVSLRLSGMRYLKSLTPEKAWEILAAGRCIISQKGYEVVQLATRSTEKMMEVRGYHLAPYIPPPLMYLRLNPADRPLLEQAVPFHLKPLVGVDVMQSYIASNSTKLAFFCACALQSKLTGKPLPLTKSLKWLVKRVTLNDRQAPFESVCALFAELIGPLAEENGVTFYRCVRDMEDINSKVLRAQAREPSAQAKRPVRNDKQEPRQEQVPQKRHGLREKKPTIKGNVSISYAEDGKKGRRKNGKNKPRSKATATPKEENGKAPEEEPRAATFMELLQKIQSSE